MKQEDNSVINSLRRLESALADLEAGLELYTEDSTHKVEQLQFQLHEEAQRREEVNRMLDKTIERVESLIGLQERLLKPTQQDRKAA